MSAVLEKCTKKTQQYVRWGDRHWIDYRCDKLTDAEINRLHKDKGFIYNCRSCSSQESIRKTIAETTDTALNLKLPECQTIEGTALDNLKEETLSMCPLCDTCINGQEYVCCMCRSMLHSLCMSESNEEVCFACASDEMQILESNMPDRGNTLHSPGHCGNILDSKKWTIQCNLIRKIMKL